MIRRMQSNWGQSQEICHWHLLNHRALLFQGNSRLGSLRHKPHFPISDLFSLLDDRHDEVSNLGCFVGELKPKFFSLFQWKRQNLVRSVVGNGNDCEPTRDRAQGLPEGYFTIESAKFLRETQPNEHPVCMSSLKPSLGTKHRRQRYP